MGYLTRMLIEKKWRENGRKDALRLARQPRPEGVAVETGLAYLPDGDPMHTLNLYRPEGARGPSAHGGGHPRGRLDVRGPGAEPKLLHGPGRPGVRRDGDELPPAAPGGPPGAGAGRVCQPPLAVGTRGGARLRPVPDSAHGRFRRRASGRPHRLHSKEPRPPSPLWGSALEA